MITRPLYLQKLISRQHNGMIKIITGMRRVGKSYLMNELLVRHLLEQGVADNHIIKVDLEDFTQYSLREPYAFLDYVLSQQQDNDMYYVLIDEVQHLNHFEDVLNTLLKHNGLDVYVTGSNSRFLSSDVITEFRGRGDEVRVFPLSFSEVASVRTNIDKTELLYEYLNYGGLPAIYNMATTEQKENYLKALFSETYLKDMHDRYRIMDDNNLEELINIVASSIGSLINPQKLENTFRSVSKSNISQATIKRYLDYLQDAFILSCATRYDIKGKRYISTPHKYYFSDLGIRNARLNFRQFEPTHLMENLIYNELLVRGFSVDVGQVILNSQNQEGVSQRIPLEVDFVCNRGSKRCYIQSAWSLPTSEKLKQEERSLLHINDSFQKIIIVGDHTPRHQTDKGTLVVNIYDFLLDKDSLTF